jgi:hypothetical protein
MRRSTPILAVAAGFLMTACATVPTGPSVMVLPGQGKNFDQFQADDSTCRQWAFQQTGTTTGNASAGSTVTGAAIGTAVGAAAGAALGAAAGNPAIGAAAGAGVGLLGGTVAGATAGVDAGSTTQRRFDMTYMQCMYAKGNQIPMTRGALPASYSVPARQNTSVHVPPPPAGPPPPPPPAGASPPPPPAGAPPPPPPPPPPR